jgi:hypothetical protein
MPAPPDVACKTTVPTSGACCQKWSELLTLESAILYRVVRDRWFIAVVVGLGALTVVLLAAALFSFS